MPKVAVYAEDLELLGVVQVSESLARSRPFGARVVFGRMPEIGPPGPVSATYDCYYIGGWIERMHRKGAEAYLLICPNEHKAELADWIARDMGELFVS